MFHSLWMIDPYLAKLVVVFTGMEQLSGGRGVDTFKPTQGVSFNGSINGSGGDDVLDYSGFTQGITVNRSTATATGRLAVSIILRSNL